jgi:RecA/RadA recombinase
VKTRNTTVINLFGGPGVGKTTLAHILTGRLKADGQLAEYVPEWVKTWAWTGRKPGPFDQAHIFGQQLQRETLLYGKVDIVVTDSPLLLSPIYERHYRGTSFMEAIAFATLNLAKQQGVDTRNVYLSRGAREYQSAGRFETEQQARAVDESIGLFLRYHRVEHLSLDMEAGTFDWAVAEIQKYAGLD